MGRRINKNLPASVLLLFFIAVIGAPLLSLLLYSFYNEGKLSFSSFQFLGNKTILLSLLNSVIIASGTALFSSVVGCILSFYLFKIKTRYTAIVRTIVMIPLFLSPYTVGVAWSDLLYRIGINQSNLQNPAGVIIVLVTIYTPIPFLIVSGSWKNIGSSIEESGLLMASYNKILWKVVLPLLKPALISSFILVFILSLSEYGLPSVFQVNTFTVQLFTQFTAFYNYSAAYAQSLILILISVLLIIPEKRYLADAPFFGFSRRGAASLLLPVQKHMPGFLACVLYLIISVLLPLVFLLLEASRNRARPILSVIDQLFPVLFSSLRYSMVAAVIMTLIGYLFSVASVRYGQKKGDLLLLLFFAVPALVTGIALIQFYNTPLLQFIYSSSLIIIIGYISRFAFIANKAISASLSQIPPVYEDAVKIISGQRSYRIFRIQLPLISEGLFNAFLISFLLCFSEISTTIMLYPPGTSLLPIKVFTLMANASQSQVSAMNSFVVLATLIIVIIFFALKKLFLNQQWRRRPAYN